MQNPFELIETRLARIEALLMELDRTQHHSPAIPTGETRYGNFNWYLTETGEAASTARQRIAKGEVPGITKLGKRLIFDKSIIRSWIQEKQRATNTQVAHTANESFNRHHLHQKKSFGRM
jgi:predicted DNA-binding transcriptional regulator AlpA